MPSAADLHCVHYLASVRLAEGGVVRAVLDLCGRLAGDGCRITLLTGDATDVPASWREDRSDTPTVVELPGVRPLGYLGPVAKRAAVAHLRQADLLHLHTPWALANLPLARWARRHGLPYLLTLHGMLDTWSLAQRPAKKRLYLALFARGLLEHAAAVHCTAEGERRQTTRWYPRGEAVVLPYLFDTAPYLELPGTAPAAEAFPAVNTDRPKVLFLSRLHYKKGIERLIDAMALLRPQGIDAQLLIAGPAAPAYEATVRQRITAAGLDDQAALLGLVSGVTKTSLYQAADLFVLPTSQENFGLVLLESMACGTPVVTTKGVDIWQEIETGGALIASAEPQELASAIGDCLKDRARCRARGEQSRQWVLDRFDPTRLGREYIELYQRLAGQNPAPTNAANG
jgi:glycosyltransferase involved in cell wall biosynthesis